jgi:hypothetical protein
MVTSYVTYLGSWLLTSKFVDSITNNEEIPSWSGAYAGVLIDEADSSAAIIICCFLLERMWRSVFFAAGYSHSVAFVDGNYQSNGVSLCKL